MALTPISYSMLKAVLKRSLCEIRFFPSCERLGPRKRLQQPQLLCITLLQPALPCHGLDRPQCHESFHLIREIRFSLQRFFFCPDGVALTPPLCLNAKGCFEKGACMKSGSHCKKAYFLQGWGGGSDPPSLSPLCLNVKCCL